MTDLCNLARRSLTHYLTHGSRYETALRVGHRAGCFVSLHEKDGALRGCIGTIEPVEKDLCLEVSANAVSAGVRDPRFPAVTAEELAHLKLEVNVLAPPRAIDGPWQLDPGKYGVVVRNGRKRGVLLPAIEGIDSVEQQLAIAKRKAKIGEHEPVQLMRFEVERHHERLA